VSVGAETNVRNGSDPQTPILVSERDATMMCGVSRPTFRNWVDAGLIVRVDLPGNVRRNLYRRSDLEQFAASLAARK